MFLQLDITFPALACSVVSLDAMDISGELHLDVVRYCDYFIFQTCARYVMSLCLSAGNPGVLFLSFLCLHRSE